MPTYFQRPENALKRANGKCYYNTIFITYCLSDSVRFARDRISIVTRMWPYFSHGLSFGVNSSVWTLPVSLFLELIAVGKKDRALESLYDVIKSKKHRTWQKIHIQIMDMYVQLCVELKKSHIAKEGLYQYKNICQQVIWIIQNYMKSGSTFIVS